MSTKKINNKTYRIIREEADFEDYLLKTNSGYYDPTYNYILEANIDWNKIQPTLRTTIKNFTGTLVLSRDHLLLNQRPVGHHRMSNMLRMSKIWEWLSKP